MSTSSRRPLVLDSEPDTHSVNLMWARYQALTLEEREAFHHGEGVEKERVDTLLTGEVWGGMRVNTDGTRDLVSFSDPEFNELLRKVYGDLGCAR